MFGNGNYQRWHLKNFKCHLTGNASCAKPKGNQLTYEERNILIVV